MVKILVNGMGAARTPLNGTLIEENRPELARKSLNGTASETEEAVPFHLIPSFFNNVDYLIRPRYTYLKICVETLVGAEFRLSFSAELATNRSISVFQVRI